MIAAGIDLGGTKSEVRVFDTDWHKVAQRRDETPTDYDALVALVADQVRWAQGRAGRAIPVGVGAAGLITAEGYAVAANLVATGHPFPADLAAASGQAITYINDCRALALSEAVFGAGKGHRVVMALILGTGIGGGVAIDGRLHSGPSGTGGEFGHAAAAASVVVRHGLPIHPCGCGRMGCVETYLSGPGLVRLAQEIMARAVSPRELATLKATDAKAAKVWHIWLEIAAEAMLAMVQAMDPDVIVLGGGLSLIDGVVDDLSHALQGAQIDGFPVPPLCLAQGGDASGARGAAYAAWQGADDG